MPIESAGVTMLILFLLAFLFCGIAIMVSVANFALLPESASQLSPAPTTKTVRHPRVA